jgi:hypothetical protein
MYAHAHTRKRTRTHTIKLAEKFLARLNDYRFFSENGISSMELITATHPSQPIPRAARSKEWFCGRSLVGIVGSNSAGGVEIFLL